MFRVGIAWRGSPQHRNDAMRSLPRESLKPLAAVIGVTWVSVTKDAWTPKLGEAGLVDGLAGCDDWLDTANALATLDLIITVDTAIAHVAGGLGVPVWILLAAVPDMRWMLESRISPWYDSATLYRQTTAGDWAPVIARVADDLQQRILNSHLMVP